MFDWFWEFLYLISKTLFRLIDGLISCANKLCGIEPIQFEGESTDFMSFLLFSEEIGFAFRVSVILAIILLVLFAVFSILRTITKEKAEGTPAQICVKAFKTLLTFLFVPAVIWAFIYIGNTFIMALYSATLQGSSSLGAFLFSVFAEDGGMASDVAQLFKSGELDYRNTDLIWSYMDLSNYSFVFSWLAGGVVLFSIGSSMLIFVDRVISIVILYIVSPISISTSLIDEGARFKLWRDQFFTKFIMGYGMILAINIYALVCGVVMTPGFSFFDEEPFLDLMMKLLLIAGGALTLQKSMALIGNLVSQGAGSNELRDNAFTAGKLASLAMGGAGKLFGMTPLGLGAKAAKSVVSDALSMKSRDLGSKMLDKLHLGIGGNTSDEKGIRDGSPSGAQNNQKAIFGGDQNSAKDAINGTGFKTSDWNNDSTNSNQPDGQRGGMVNDAIRGSDSRNANTSGKEEGNR